MDQFIAPNSTPRVPIWVVLLIATCFLMWGHLAQANPQTTPDHKPDSDAADWFGVNVLSGLERKDAKGRIYRLTVRTDHSTDTSVWLIERGETLPAALLSDWNWIVMRDSDLKISCRQRPELRTLSVGETKLSAALFFLEDEITGGPLGAVAGVLIQHKGALTYLWVERYLSFAQRLTEQDDRPTEDDTKLVLHTLAQILGTAPRPNNFTIQTPTLEPDFCARSSPK